MHRMVVYHVLFCLFFIADSGYGSCHHLILLYTYQQVLHVKTCNVARQPFLSGLVTGWSCSGCGLWSLRRRDLYMHSSCALRQSGLVPSGCRSDGVVTMHHRPSLFILPRKMLGRHEGVQHATLRQVVVKLRAAIGAAVVTHIWIRWLKTEQLLLFATGTRVARVICYYLPSTTNLFFFSPTVGQLC